MKEIKFRAWDEKDKIMWEPQTFRDLIIGGWELETKYQESSLPQKDYVMFAHDDTIWMQSTGLRDRLGKDIYEGDILCVIDEDGKLSYSVCEYGIHRREMASGWTVDIPGFSFVKKDGFKSFPIVKNYAGGHDLEILEVAGNIYQNPELLTHLTHK